jgi:uncharacterized protein (TIGR03437 family)
MSEVVGSGSEITGSLAPGELISIFGTALGGPPQSNSTQVMIGGTAAPLIYASPNQVNAIVPFEAGSTGTATVQVIAAGVQSGTWAIPLAPSEPSVFTISASGVGPGAIVNQDGSINAPSNPAARGTFIQIYATGGGQTSPPSSTGTVATGAAGLTLPVTVSIGGVNAQVLYAGNAPGEFEGVVQINAIVAQSATPGPALPVIVTIGGAASQTGVTVAVQ